MKKAVILARGLGKRMRAADPSAVLSPQQAVAAASGSKAMIQFASRPFLDYVLSGLADGGIRELCLVIGPEHAEMRDYCDHLRTDRIQIEFAIQREPLGTADALLCAEGFTAGEFFLSLNSDNLYPVAAHKALKDLNAPGLPAFELDALVRNSNIPRERFASYALLEVDADGFLRRIIEKPDAATFAAWPAPKFLSANLWSFGPRIFEACRQVAPSPRGELELPLAVQFALSNLGERFRVLQFHEGILDLSSRADVSTVAARLAGVDVNL
ncbi:MAG: nucleotidyltransferase family protein [Candidatus Acidiferrales bacterium]